MLDDLKHSFRALRRAPMSSLSAICILAVAIGASTAVFTVVDKVLIRPLPLEDPHRIVVIWPRETCPGTNGPSSRTRNHVPNSRWSVSARQTRDTGALSSMVFSMRSVMCNLLVAYYVVDRLQKRNYFVAKHKLSSLEW